MLQTILAALSAAMLVAASTLAARRWGLRVGGVVSAFPAIVGPILVLVAVEHGPAAAARNADGTLLGLVGLAAFTAAYARAALRRGWTASLLGGWVAAAVAGLAAAAAGARAGALVGLLIAGISLWLAHRSLLAASLDQAALPLPSLPGTRTSIPARMAVTALIVIALAGSVSALGPLVGGILAALPVLASVLVVLAHREAGAMAAVALLRGTLAGMGGFVAFCLIVALLITRTPLVPAFAVATIVALVVQAPALRARGT